MITAEELCENPLFAEIPRNRLDHVIEVAADIELRDGEYAVHEGENPAFYYVLSGNLAITKRFGNVEQQIALRGPNEYFGDLPMMLGAATFANAKAVGETRIMRLDDVAFRNLMHDSPRFAAEVATSVAGRVNDMQTANCAGPARSVTIIGKRGEEACHALRDFLYRNRVAFDWIEPANALAAEALGDKANLLDQCPLVKLADGEILVQPPIRHLACAIGLPVDPQKSDYDLIVIGGGPAGLAAAVYGASEGLATLMVETEAPGGQAGTSSRIENYLGFPSGISGDELGSRAFQQAERLGAESIVTRTVSSIRPGQVRHELCLDGGQCLTARAIIFATGVRWREFNASGMDRLSGHGVFYGASRSEARSVRGLDIHIVGGGNSAGQAAVFFANFAKSVTILVRGESLAQSMSAYLITQLNERNNISIETHSEIIAVDGAETLSSITVRGPNGERTRESGGLFIFIGAVAETDWVPQEVQRDDHGYILTGTDLPEHSGDCYPGGRDPFLLETSVPAIFACGDVRHGSVKRVAAAVGEGSMAVAFVHQALAAVDAPLPATV